MNAGVFYRLSFSLRGLASHHIQWHARQLSLTVRGLRTGQYLLSTEGERKLSELLRDKLQPTYLTVQDMSGGCGSAYSIQIDCDQFKGKRPVQQHKMVTEALGDEMKDIHAVSIRIGKLE